MLFLGSYSWIYLESLSNWVQFRGACCVLVSGSLKQSSPAGQWLESVLGFAGERWWGGFGGDWQGDQEQCCFCQAVPMLWGPRWGWHRHCLCGLPWGQGWHGVRLVGVYFHHCCCLWAGTSPALLCVPFISWSLPVAWGRLLLTSCERQHYKPLFI